MLDYRVPSIVDSPPIDVHIVESMDPNGPFGAKEAGEGSLSGFLPALTNAVAEAIGVRFLELPITPDKVLRALEKKAKGEEPRVGPEHFPAVPYPEPVVVPPPWEGGDGNAVKGAGPKVKVPA